MSTTDDEHVVQGSNRTDETVSTIANQLKSPFLGLPGELRNRIYDLVFWEGKASENALLKTCVQTAYEAKPLYFSNLTISVILLSSSNMKPMVDATKPEMLARIRSIRTSAVPTSVMLLRLAKQKAGLYQVADEYIKYAACLPGLRHWHVVGDTSDKLRAHMVDGLRELMGREVEVTFAPEETLKVSLQEFLRLAVGII